MYYCLTHKITYNTSSVIYKNEKLAIEFIDVQLNVYVYGINTFYPWDGIIITTLVRHYILPLLTKYLYRLKFKQLYINSLNYELMKHYLTKINYRIPIVSPRLRLLEIAEINKNIKFRYDAIHNSTTRGDDWEFIYNKKCNHIEKFRVIWRPEQKRLETTEILNYLLQNFEFKYLKLTHADIFLDSPMVKTRILRIRHLGDEAILYGEVFKNPYIKRFHIYSNLVLTHIDSSIFAENYTLISTNLVDKIADNANLIEKLNENKKLLSDKHFRETKVAPN
jgi:hypothetical protein